MLPERAALCKERLAPKVPKFCRNCSDFSFPMKQYEEQKEEQALAITQLQQ